MLRTAVFLVALLSAAGAAEGREDSAQAPARARLDAALRARAEAPVGTSRVIVRTTTGRPVDAVLRAYGATPGPWLPLVDGQVAHVPDTALAALAASPAVARISLDRPVHGTIERTAAAIGALWAREHFDVEGRDVGIAIVDSGVTAWHDDLGTERVVHFVDFVSGRATPYDDYGHGTHVAGIIAGSGFSSDGGRRGIAPGARLIALKALDGRGEGYASTVIAAMHYAIAQRDRFNIRVINLSVAAGVHESFTTDPLALAARRAVEAGIVVVTAAGNFGRDADGQPLAAGITSPGNAPWVLTVGAGSHNGTARRRDDTVAPFSSRGPTAIDGAVKPDLVAPGVGIASLADRDSLLFQAHAGARLWGTRTTAAEPYLRLSGTSMAAPVVTGTIALMLEANPALTPNLVKAILQYTAEDRPGIDDYTEGAGSLNARGAVQLARELAGGAPAAVPADPTPWSRQILWGQQRITGGALRPEGTAWRLGVTWGDPRLPDGEPVTWGASENEFAEAIPWSAAILARGPWASCEGAACAAPVRAAALGPLACGGQVTCEDVNWEAAAALRAWRLLLVLPRGQR